VVQYEEGAFDAIDRDTLGELGYKFKHVGRQYGNMQVVLTNRRTGKMQAASDPRGEGLAAVREIRPQN